MADFRELIKVVTEAVDKFNRNVPGIQRTMLDEVMLLIKQLDTRDDRIRVSASNLRVLSQISRKLQKIILSDDYLLNVKDYVKTFDRVVKLQNEYFSQVEARFKPPKLANEIRKQAIGSVVNSLTENGLAAEVTDKIADILRKSVTSGGSYANLAQQLQDFILDNNTGDGKLMRYTKQITTDAINQFSGQYTQIIASDLGFEWFRYSGSNIETSRDFCIACTTRKFFHISELPKVLKGDFDEFRDIDGRINKRTGLPYGMIPGTDVSNFMTNRGGYNCGHQWRPVSEDLVPQERKLDVYASAEYRLWAQAHGRAVPDPPPKPPKPKEGPKPQPPKQSEPEPPKPKKADTPAEQRKNKILEKHETFIEDLKKKKITIHEDLLTKLGEEITFEKGQKDEAFYSPIGKKIVIGDLGERLSSQYFKDSIMAHELGHAIHNTKGIIHLGKVSGEYAAHFRSLRKIIKGKEDEIEAAFWKAYRGADSDTKEQLLVIFDILGSLTGGKYGGGHLKSYYKKPGKSEAEIFAHSISLLKVTNRYEDLTPEVKQVIDSMKEYVSKVL